MSHEVQQVELHGTRRCNISLQLIPGTYTPTVFMDVQMLWFCLCYMPPLHDPNACHLSVYYTVTFLSLQHVAVTCMSLRHDPSCRPTFCNCSRVLWTSMLNARWRHVGKWLCDISTITFLRDSHVGGSDSKVELRFFSTLEQIRSQARQMADSSWFIDTLINRIFVFSFFLCLFFTNNSYLPRILITEGK